MSQSQEEKVKAAQEAEKQAAEARRKAEEELRRHGAAMANTGLRKKR
ncbi:hypothetical protein [Streptomyces albidoflavus]|nr:hypothetical protein [Streptomyces albidoflavus]